MVRRDVILILAVARINQEVKPAICILHFGQEVGFPFCFLQNVTLAIAALWNPKIIETADSRETIGRKNQMMDKRRTVIRVLAIVSRIVVAAAQFKRTRIDKRVKAGGNVLELRCGMSW